jgi:hypothetical protein
VQKAEAGVSDCKDTMRSLRFFYISYVVIVFTLLIDDQLRMAINNLLTIDRRGQFEGFTMSNADVWL